ncbi:hypothetical protein H4J56_05900 [Colwellia sp. BRX8-4]|jgi:hypothetical protein|uniref:hypothetical protein n=1 Tax=Colwellia sp. BRX8-4 TaxID=2759836 RepID=UPI0015F5A31E|nr:hypothetical protein [Colwellia sp. BRX8-4]MBA6364630.1 hypothetical protein [Colwellia sp. BRX8-8]MBA6370958.1 hypothetical protein [Colwellia sp. BRX8-4]
MNNPTLTQVKIIQNHLENIGPINTDEARLMYAIVDVPRVVSTLSKMMNIRHIPINNRSPVTGKIRGIMKYVLEQKEKPISDKT